MRTRLPFSRPGMGGCDVGLLSFTAWVFGVCPQGFKGAGLGSGAVLNGMGRAGRYLRHILC